MPRDCSLALLPTSGDGDTSGLVDVDPHPVAATLLWLPGLNSTTCRAQLTTLPTPAAAQLANDLSAASAVPPGRYNCPADYGTAVTVYFRYSQGPNAQIVNVALSGCGFITAPGRAGRRMTEAIRADLLHVSPPDWARYLTDR